MFSHITVGTNDLLKSECFYSSILLPLGYIRREVTPDGGPKACCWLSKEAALPRFYVYEPFNKQVATPGNGAMVSFLAPDIVSIKKSYAAGLQNGGVDDGDPDERAHYGVGYYGVWSIYSRS
ncbi:VOC family protein [Shewanella glacialimarina]|jgi:catechol 2,3-dioxygenase-like lactoylglutathione lyase family enzyme|uniref:VOC family protein n=1 Tax=Shewanella glacialimarina TaxID=2590884 RepID=UPI001CF922EE|nr:VOC family protein [Shewanella glacialimarina]